VSGLSELGMEGVPKCQILETTTHPLISNLLALPYFRNFRTRLKPPTHEIRVIAWFHPYVTPSRVKADLVETR
jgi:hypothetical protein